jgi:hypothetical protein
MDVYILKYVNILYLEEVDINKRFIEANNYFKTSHVLYYDFFRFTSSNSVGDDAAICGKECVLPPE